MIHSISRAVAAALLGGLAGAACFVVGFAMHPDLMFEMDRDLPRIASGFYPVERYGEETFAWTSRRAEVRLSGLDRRSPWRCLARFRGGRPNQMAQPLVDIAVDGVTVATRPATNDYQDLAVTVPARWRTQGLSLAIVSSTTFVPGPSDPRELGVQVDRLVCGPTGGGLALPPRRTIAGAALAASALGAALGLTGITARSAVAGALLLAAAQAVPLSTGPAPYSAYADKVVWIAIWIGLTMLLGLNIVQWARRQPLHHAARFVVVFSVGSLYLKLLALLHPSKPVVDALFHAHRFEWVLSGRYYFTQPMPDGVQFPYAIGLYLFAAPWSVVTRDHVTLLRVVVCASEVIAGALLYPMIMRIWGDRLTGVTAVALFNLVPLPYWVVGNANLTNAFGQSAALVTIVAATAWPLGPRQFGQLLGLSLLATLAFLSHVSTFGLLLATLLALAFCYRWIGGPTLRAQARTVLCATTVAALISIVSYYGHFGEVYKNLRRVRPEAAAIAPSDGLTHGTDTAADRPPARGGATPLHVRTANALALSITDIGWPIAILAILGAWCLWVAGARDRLVFAVSAWGVAYLAFSFIGVLTPVNMRFERYAAEFISRVDYAIYPAAVILAARGATWAWRAGPAPRMASAALLLSAVIGGVQQWAHWLD